MNQNRQWYVSDLHFFHNNIMKFTKRPFTSLDEMHESIITEWNKDIYKGDLVYHLGDLSFLSGKYDQQPLYDILNQLNGTIISLKGNHDYSTLLNKHRQAQIDGRLRTGIYFEDTPYKEIKHNKRKIILSHYPICCWNGQHHNSIHLHGHCHNKLRLRLGKAIDVGYDALWEEYGLLRPISFEEMIEVVNSKEPIYYDHHGSPRLTGQE